MNGMDGAGLRGGYVQPGGKCLVREADAIWRGSATMWRWSSWIAAGCAAAVASGLVSANEIEFTVYREIGPSYVTPASASLASGESAVVLQPIVESGESSVRVDVDEASSGTPSGGDNACAKCAACQGTGCPGGCAIGREAECENCCGGLFGLCLTTYADWLNWRATRAATPFTLGGEMGGFNTLANDPIVAEFDHDGGMRFGLNQQLVSGWDTNFEYVYFANTGQRRVGNGAVNNNNYAVLNADTVLLDQNQSNLTNNIGDIENGFADYARDEIDVKLNVFDLDAGHSFSPTQFMTARVFGGVRYASFGHQSKVMFKNLDVAEGNFTDTYWIHNDTEMHGWGLKMGTSAAWHLMGGPVTVFGRATVSVIDANFHITRHDLAENQSIASTSSVTREIDVDGMVPVLELRCGAQVDFGPFFLYGGYDAATWFQMVQNVRLESDTVPAGNLQVIGFDRGDIGLGGAFAGGGIVY